MGICTFSQRQAYSSDAYDDTLNPNNYSTATTLEEDLNYIRSTIKQLTVLVGGGPDWIDVPGSLSTATITAGGLMSAADKQKLDTIETGAQVNPTPAALLTIIESIDGAGSGLDADLLDGQQGSYYLAASSYTAADVLAKLLTVDGPGSNLNADLLDGINSTGFVQNGNVSKVFAGYVEVNLSGTTFTGMTLHGPTGWTVTRSSVGHYLITHNLGLSSSNPNIGLPVTATMTDHGSATQTASGPTAFNVYLTDSSGTNIDGGFVFVATLIDPANTENYV